MNEKKARELLGARSNGVCELCTAARATNAHHRKNASQGGQWAPSNLLHLCGSGTTGCHGFVTREPRKAREQGWSVPSWGDPERTPVWLAWRGRVFLDDTGHIEQAEETA